MNERKAVCTPKCTYSLAGGQWNRAGVVPRQWPTQFTNRSVRRGALPPSLPRRVCNLITGVRRLRGLSPIRAISQELVRVDTQAMGTADIEGVAYQQGQLAGYEVRAHVLLTRNHQCACCDAREVPLELDHIQPRSKQGSNRVSNLTLACHCCNQRKGNQDIHVFLRDEPQGLSQFQAPRRDAAAVNATRCALHERLTCVGLPVECGGRGLTKYNRVSKGLPRTHCCDAGCVGRRTPQTLDASGIVLLQITATGYGSRQMCRMDAYGFCIDPRQHKRVQGFQTGDMVRAVVAGGRKASISVGRVAARTSGSFTIATSQGVVQGIPIGAVGSSPEPMGIATLRERSGHEDLAGHFCVPTWDGWSLYTRERRAGKE